MEIKIEAQRWDEVLAVWKTAPKIVRDEMTAAILKCESLLQRELQEHAPVGAYGLLRDSFSTSDPVVEGDTILGVVGSALIYAEPVELGTRPHWAPIQPLRDWVEAKFGVEHSKSWFPAKNVQKKIAREGTKGQFIFKNTLESKKRDLDEILEKHAERILTRLAGA